MSLYQLSKLLYNLNRDDKMKAQFAQNRSLILAGYDLSEEEKNAIINADIGLIYVLGVNGQILMHFAALCGIEWADYLQMMRDGIKKHGPVRAGVYALMTNPDEKLII